MAVVLGALLAGAWYGLRAPEPPPFSAEPAASAAPGQVTLHVAGAVEEPGLVSVSEGSRVADAIAAAGGALPDADLGSVNLAAPVADSDRIDVPRRGEQPGEGVGDSASGVDLNRADAGELEALPGVGPVLAARIVAYRDAHGPFRSVEDLLDVPGIGEAKLAAMREAIASP